MHCWLGSEIVVLNKLSQRSNTMFIEELQPFDDKKYNLKKVK